jgi:D-tyrosyl-tRNA(Tyr) deacylase
MIALIQRVSRGSVSVARKIVNSINQGFVILLGVKETDSEKETRILAEKTVNLHIMADDKNKMNLSILDVQGEILVISQFTLHADLTSGRRPSFIKSAKPEIAEKLYELYINELKKLGVTKVVSGKFGGYMNVEIINDGPVTIIADTEDFVK